MTITLCYEAHRPDGRVWAVKAGRTWHTAKRVFVHVPMWTVHKGPKAKQPKAYLTGRGRITWHGDHTIFVKPLKGFLGTIVYEGQR